MNLTFKFTIEEVNALLSALGQLRYVDSVNLINMIHTQAGPQIKAANDAAANAAQSQEVVNG